MFYKKELEALKKSGRYRTRTVESSRCKDFASNDYLGLAHKKDLHKNAAKRLYRVLLQNLYVPDGNHL